MIEKKLYHHCIQLKNLCLDLPTLYPPPIFVPTANTITNKSATAAATTILMKNTYRESLLNTISS